MSRILQGLAIVHSIAVSTLIYYQFLFMNFLESDICDYLLNTRNPTAIQLSPFRNDVLHRHPVRATWGSDKSPVEMSNSPEV